MSRILAALAILSLGCFAIGRAAGGRDGATIINSGSTNFSGYTIKVWSDGSAQWYHSRAGAPPLDKPVKGSVPAPLALKLLADLKAGKHAGRLIPRPCMKPPSFSATMVAVYHGWTSPDLICGGDGFVNAIGSDANKIVAALGVKPLGTHRVPLLPNEKRSVPSEGSPQPQASASPEPAPRAS